MATLHDNIEHGQLFHDKSDGWFVLTNETKASEESEHGYMIKAVRLEQIAIGGFGAWPGETLYWLPEAEVEEGPMAEELLNSFLEGKQP